MSTCWSYTTFLALLFFCFLTGCTSPDRTHPTVVIWPKGTQDENGQSGVERDTTKPTDDLVAGKRLIRLSNVNQPTITVYRPSARRDTGITVMICPGGGYHILAMDLEGTEVCEWLNSIGVTAVLLKYRVPAAFGSPAYAAPLADAQRAFSIVKQHADEWGIKRIGVLGFSAGGHLAAAFSTATNRTYAAIDDADKGEITPAFTVLIYPWHLTEEKDADRISPELHITTNTPPTFISITEDDPVRMENAVYYALALKKSGVPLELHVYPKGGHGYGLRQTDNPATWWPRQVEEWLRHSGWLETSP